MAAGLAATPEASPHTSVHQRVERAEAQWKLDELQAAARGSVAGSRAAGALEDDLWLCPIEDRRREGSLREELLEGFSLGSSGCLAKTRLLGSYTARGQVCPVGAQIVERNSFRFTRHKRNEFRSTMGQF